MEGEAKRPISPTLLWLSIGFFFMFAGAAQQQFQSPFWNGAMGWSPVRRSVILAVVYLTFGFWRLRIGWFIAAWGEKTVLLLGSATYGLFSLAVWATTDYPLLLLAAAIWGWGGAANWGTSAVMVLDATHDRRYGSSSGLFMGMTRLGFAIGVVLLSFVYDAAIAAGGPLAGRAVWAWSAVFSFVGVACLVKVPARRVAIDPPSWSQQWAIMRSPKGATGSFFLFLVGMGFGVVLSVLADHLATAFPGGNKLYLMAFFSLSGFLVDVVGGSWSDRIGRPRAFFLTFVIAAGGMFLAVIAPKSLIALSVCALFLGFQAGLVPTLTMAMIGDATVAARRQNVYGALFFWRDMGVAGSLVFAQCLQQLADIRVALAVMALLMLLCAWLSLLLDRRIEEAM